MNNIFEHTTEIALLLIIIAVVGLTSAGIEITEPMKTMVLTITGAYFGAKVPKVK